MAPTPKPDVVAGLRGLGHSVRDNRWVLLAGLCVSGLSLWATASAPYPVRDLPAELRGLAASLPLGVVLTIVHTRRRRPQLINRAVGLFVLAFTLRVVVMGPLIDYKYRLDPVSNGIFESDTSKMTYAIRYAIFAVTGDDVGLRRDERRFFAAGGLFGVTRDDTEVFTQAPPFKTLVAVWLGLLGYSSAAALLPMVAIGSFFAVQCYIFAYRCCRPSTAAAVAAFMLVDSGFVLGSLTLLKGFPTGVALFLLFELALEPPPLRLRRVVAQFAVAAALTWLVRPQLVPALALMAGYMLARSRWVPASARGRLDVLAALGATLFGFVLSRSNSMYDPSAPGLFAYWPGLVLEPFLPVFAWTLNDDLLTDAKAWAHAGTALVWPVVSTLLLLGLGLYRTQRIRVPAELLVCTWLFVCLATSRSAANVVAVWHRQPIVPIMLMVAFEAVAALRVLPSLRRRRLVALGVTWCCCFVALNVLYKLRF